MCREDDRMFLDKEYNSEVLGYFIEKKEKAGLPLTLENKAQFLAEYDECFFDLVHEMMDLGIGHSMALVLEYNLKKYGDPKNKTN